jgi:hypothetical protein
MCVTVPYSSYHLLNAVEKLRDVDIRTSNGERSGNLLYQLREDNLKCWLFICHGKKPDNIDIVKKETLQIIISGEYNAQLYDTLTGNITPLTAEISGGKTIINYMLYCHDSLLIKLSSSNIKRLSADEPSVINHVPHSYLPQPEEITLSEPNAAILDIAGYSFDGGAWQGPDEILRIDNMFRELCGFPLRKDALEQPWVTPDETPRHKLSLRFTVQAARVLTGTLLALENASQTAVTVNGKSVPSVINGWYADKSIQTIALPELKHGANTIELVIPFGKRTAVEACYLLGSFGVETAGSAVTVGRGITAAFGDWTRIGLPFYGGNVTYKCRVDAAGGHYFLEASHYRNPLLTVCVDGGDKGRIVYAPYRVDLGVLSPGAHVIEITAFGNRYNTFGALHNADYGDRWAGPNAWRTEGARWSYEYQLSETGLLTAPRLFKC